ncbi:MAG: methylmalonyl-CoA mutase family protein, partial [Chloroflexota bacterium]|nr:methylmalonyl-CoA mutase family protein [Chloroflexota bacterium]
SHKPAAKHLDISLRTAGDIIEYCTRYLPLAIPVNVNQGTIRTVGLPEAFDGALGIARAMTYVDEVLRRGLNIDDFAHRIVFLMCATPQIFTEVARIRAVRKIWAQIVRDRYGAKNPRSWAMRLSLMPATYPLTPQEPWNNITRLTLQTLACVLSGTQAMYVPCYDEPIAIPTEESHRTSLRIQQIIAFESEAVNVADPLGGSYYVEYLTNELERQIQENIHQIEERGGTVKAIESGWLDNELEKASLQYRREIESGKRVLVGMNLFAIPSEQDRIIEVHRNPPESAQREIGRVTELKRIRDNQKVRETLGRLKDIAGRKDGTNLIPFIKEAVQSYATTGEIVGMINQAYGYPYDNFEMVPSPF